MLHRLAPIVALTSLLVPACAADDDTPSSPDAAVVLPNGLVSAMGGGYCCPIVDASSCNCFPNGGWTATADATRCPMICDLAPVNTRIEKDTHGCDQLVGPESCPGAGAR